MNQKYIYEMHCHTGEFGWCAKVPAETLVRDYAEAAYQGICISNHYFGPGFDAMQERSWTKKMDRYLSGYHTARSAAKAYDMDILLALELRFDSVRFNDFLVYGMDEDLLYTYPKLYAYTPKEFKLFCEKHGLMIFQAHPFRSPCHPMEPQLLDGLEVNNANPRHDSKNALSLAMQKETGLLAIGGSDYHQLEDLALSGCIFKERICSSDALVKILTKQKAEPQKALYEIISNRNEANPKP